MMNINESRIVFESIYIFSLYMKILSVINLLIKLLKQIHQCLNKDICFIVIFYKNSKLLYQFFNVIIEKKRRLSTFLILY